MLVLFDPVASSIAGAFFLLPIIAVALVMIAISLLRVYRSKKNIK
jgi:hypothetical protein